MANKNINGLTAITVPLAGTEVIPIWNGTTTTKVAVSDLTAGRTVTMSGLTVSGAGAAATSPSVTATTGTNYIGYKLANTGGSLWFAMDNSVGSGFNTGTAYAGAIWRSGLNPICLVTNSINRLQVEANGDITVKTGNLVQGTAAKGINFTANTPAAGMTSQLLNWYEEGTYTATGTGFTTSPTATFYYTIIGRQVTIDMRSIVGVSNATTFTVTGMPSALFPPTAKNILVYIRDNTSTYQVGAMAISTAGVMTIYKDLAATAFTASGTKQLVATPIVYTLT